MSDKVTQNEIGSLTQEQIVEWLRRWLERNSNGIVANEMSDKSRKEMREESPHA